MIPSERDRDYLSFDAVPHASESLSPVPVALPRNLVQNLGDKGREDESNYDTNEVHLRLVNKSSIKVPKRSYRDVHHYLNNHFQLNRGDCQAQVKLGTKKYRSLLMRNASVEGSNSYDVPTPDPNILRKIVNEISLAKATTVFIFNLMFRTTGCR
jgi:hypothetical protein